MSQHLICTVSFTDPESISSAIDVMAATLYEAEVLAVAEFRRVGYSRSTSDPVPGSG